MTETSPAFVFNIRPKSCAGDLRISWRVSLALIMLFCSRGKKASFAKLHVLNDALRSQDSQEKLKDILQRETPMVFWRLRVEPAFSRALDYLVGEGFAKWTVSNSKTTLVLSQSGRSAAERVIAEQEVLVREKEFLGETGPLVTEAFVQSLLAAGKKLI